MKKIVFLIFIISSMNVFSQHISSKKKKIFSCTDIKNFKSIDSSLYDVLPNGKLIFAAHKRKSKIFKVINEDNDAYFYASKPIIKKIRRSIRKNKCRKIKIINLRSSKNNNIVRD